MDIHGIGFDMCPKCGHRADVDPDRSNLQEIHLYCVNCKATARVERSSIGETPIEWTKPEGNEAYLESRGQLRLRAGFDRRAGVAWVRIDGPPGEILGTLEGDPATHERVKRLLDPHLDRAG